MAKLRIFASKHCDIFNQGLTRSWLRWYDRDNNWLPTPVEQEKQRAEQEKQRADLAEAELAKLRQLLAEKGVNL